MEKHPLTFRQFSTYALLSLLKRGTVALQAGANSSAGTGTACLTSSSIDWAKDSMVSFSSTSVMVVAGVFFELCYGHALEPSPGGQVWTPGRPRVLDQAADDFLPNLLFSQLVVVCTVLTTCWNLLEPARATYSKEVACVCASSSTYFYSKFSREPSRGN